MITYNGEDTFEKLEEESLVNCTDQLIKRTRERERDYGNMLSSSIPLGCRHVEKRRPPKGALCWPFS